MKTITLNNYYTETKAVFTKVTDHMETEIVTSLKPIHEKIYHYTNWFGYDDFDFFYLHSEKQMEERTPEEVELGVIGCAGDLSRALDESGNEIENETAFYILEEGHSNRYLCRSIEGKVNSRTWEHDGFIYRKAYYWGKLGLCHWTIEGEEPGEVDECILAKCPINEFTSV